jgi:putative oxidoreductase
MLTYLTLALRVFIGGYFLYAAIPKIAEPLAFATSISHYHLLPSFAVNAFALVIPWLELLAGAALVVGFRIRTSALLCGLMLVMFTSGVAWAVANGLQIDCGCFGSQGGEEVSWLKVAKNSLMILGCALMVWRPASALSLDSRRATA